MAEPSPQDLVADFLRAQNLEHVREVEAAVVLYEGAVEARFDSAGPYDRLIAIYQGRAAHAEVIRVSEAALDHVRTHDDKRLWYRRLIADAQRALTEQPDPSGAEF